MKKSSIASCRVSTPEQKLNNSLNRQEKNALKVAAELGTEIIRWWSGDVSSKAGTNVKRKDLKEMEEFCKQNKNVKYLIVDEPDRFMRSIDEAFYFEVLFRELGVKVWYACDPMLNTGDLNAKMLKFSKYFPAEGSNVERITKSINGQVAALQEGRYTFSPKPGYRRGYERGIQEVHEVRGPALKKVLIDIVTRCVTVSQGLVDLNDSDFMKGHAPYKMDKFRKIVTDPFYAGIVEINKQVKVRNENGLHEPLITKEQHYELLKIMQGKAKNQSGPRKNGNPKYPASNLTTCEQCSDKRNGRFVGFDHSNGKANGPTYEKYRCRACGKYLTRQDLHAQIEQEFKDNQLTDDGIQVFMESLESVWKQNEGEVNQEVNRIEHKIKVLRESIQNHVEAVTDPSNFSIKDELLKAIDKKRIEAAELQDEIEKLKTSADDDREEFLKFALKFAKDMGGHFLDPSLSPENRLRCKDIVFPAGFYVDKNKRVYTPQKSLLITLAAKKKDAEASRNSHLVQSVGKNLHSIREEIARWREILAIPYQQYLR